MEGISPEKLKITCCVKTGPALVLCGFFHLQLYLCFAVRHRFPEQECSPMPKRTFQPNRRRRSKTHGFLSRMKTKAGAAVLSRRRAKGRHKIAVSAGYRD